MQSAFFKEIWPRKVQLPPCVQAYFGTFAGSETQISKFGLKSSIRFG